MHSNSPETGEAAMRKFGFLIGLLIPLIFGILHPWMRGSKIAYWPFAIGFIFLVLALVSPMLLSGPYRFWMMIGHVLGTINTYIVMTVVYLLLFIPISIYFKVKGRDVLLIKKFGIARNPKKTYKIYSPQNENFPRFHLGDHFNGFISRRYMGLCKSPQKILATSFNNIFSHIYWNYNHGSRYSRGAICLYAFLGRYIIVTGDSKHHSIVNWHSAFCYE